MKKNNKRRMLLLAIFTSFVLIISGCGERIETEELEEKNIVLSRNLIELDRLQNEDFYLGIKNNYEKEQEFSLVIKCLTDNCENNLVLQTFPSIGIEANKNGAFPMRINALEDAQKSEYQYEFDVMKNDELYGQERLTVVVTGAVEEMKKELVQRIN
ncbi:hypothetical protein GF371_00130 [Candidatus Woesearchaeota archaeon]|nr:hypothetical protein [Candidatus Woesearchaeota archaeon]